MTYALWETNDFADSSGFVVEIVAITRIGISTDHTDFLGIGVIGFVTFEELPACGTGDISDGALGTPL